jgi:sugar lactone lactonase YvrE
LAEDAEAFSPSGTILAVATGQTIRLWDITTGKQVGAPIGLGASSLAFSPDGTTLAVLDTPHIELWDLATRQQVGTPLRAPAATAGDVPGQETITFSADGATLAEAGFSSVSLWDVGLPGRLAAAACTISGRSFTRHDWHIYLPSEPFRQTCPRPRNQSRTGGTPAPRKTSK